MAVPELRLRHVLIVCLMLEAMANAAAADCSICCRFDCAICCSFDTDHSHLNLQYSDLNLDCDLNPLVNWGAWKLKNSYCLTVTSVLNKPLSVISNGNGGTSEPETRHPPLCAKDQSKRNDASKCSCAIKEDEKNSKLKSTKNLLDYYIEVVRKQVEKGKEHQREIKQKENDERMKSIEAKLEKQSVRLLSIREELKALKEKAFAQMNDVKENIKFERLRALISDLRSELISSPQSLDYFKNMEDQAQAMFDEFNPQVSDVRKPIARQEENRKRASWELKSNAITLFQKETPELELGYCKPRYPELSNAENALAKVHNYIAYLQKLINIKEQHIVQASISLSENENRILVMQQDLDDTVVRFREAVSMAEKIARLTNKLVVPAEDKDSDRMRIKQLETELGLMKELLREKELDLQRARSDLAAKEEELYAFVRKWESQEKETDEMETLHRICSVEVLATRKLELDVAMREAEAAARVLTRVVDFTLQKISEVLGSDVMDSLRGLVFRTLIGSLSVEEFQKKNP